jgi:nicotinamidase-related amidase
MAAALLIIDVQQGFINAATRHLPDRVAALQDEYDRIFATQFVNPPGSPYRQLMGWERFAPGSADLQLAFTPRDDATVIEKPVYTCVTPAFLDQLRRERIDELHLCGIATDNCVLKCAVDLFEAGLRPLVLADFCASHAGADHHTWGLAIIARFIGEKQVRRAAP